MISESGFSIFEGSIPSAASKRVLKESKIIERERKAIFWTPVMVWPTGFLKKHAKEVKEYFSTECLHNNRWPVLPPHLIGGVIIDLNHTKDVLAQIKTLIQIEALESDQLLAEHLARTQQAIRSTEDRSASKDGLSILKISQSALV